MEVLPYNHAILIKQAMVWLLNVNDTLTIDSLLRAISVPSDDKISEDVLVSISCGLIVVDSHTRATRLVRE